MKARGEIRLALAAAAATFGKQGATWREMAVVANVGFDLARMTFENMQRAGELVLVGTRSAPGGGRPMNVCAAPAALAVAAEQAVAT